MDFEQPAMKQLAHQGNGLKPAEAFLYPLSLPLADRIPWMSRGTAINGTAAPARLVLRHVRGNSHVPTLFDEIPRIKSFVSTYRHRLSSRDLLEYDHGSVAFCGPVGLDNFGVQDHALRFSTNRVPL